MIETFLTSIGMQCGSLKNFINTIAEDAKKNNSQHWYFLTPVKPKDNGSGYKEVTINFAYPILAIKDEDVNEKAILTRISVFQNDMESELINFLRKYVQVPSYTFTVVPDYSGNTNERNERNTFGGHRIHALIATLTIRYRENWFNCNCK